MKQWYYAKDRRRFGPFQKSHVEELYRKGELAAGDLVWEEGTPEWLEAGRAFGPLAVTAPTETGDGRLHPFACLARGWNLVWKYPAHLIGGIFIVGAICSIVSIPSYLGSIIMDPALGQIFHFPEQLRPLGIALYLIGLCINILAWPLLAGGALRMTLQTIRTGTPDLADLFYAARNFTTVGVPLILAHLLVNVLVIFGMFCLVIPGIWLAVHCLFVKTILIDTRPGVIAALKRSWQLTKGNWWRLFGLQWLFVGLILCGYLTCCIGLIVAMPIIVATFIYAYDDLTKLRR
ncbi:MAG: GYF domain-containing protein [Verrucomicrobiales bacterium]|jgi:hypothetical protein|nr:GYF domain-containing protein [Verrucomicrobiales bacterium]